MATCTFGPDTAVVRGILYTRCYRPGAQVGSRVNLMLLNAYSGAILAESPATLGLHGYTPVRGGLGISIPIEAFLVTTSYTEPLFPNLSELRKLHPVLPPVSKLLPEPVPAQYLQPPGGSVSSNGLSSQTIGAIVGGACAGGVLLVAVVFATVQRNKKKQQQHQFVGGSGDPGETQSLLNTTVR